VVDFTVLSLSEKVVKAILEDLTDRRGLRQEWEQIDEDIQREIRSTEEGMKKAICSVCERKYWAQVRPYGTMITLASGKSYFQTEPKTTKCKKHAAPTKVHPKTAKHHFSRDVKRRINRRSLRGLAPKTRKEKEDATV
jgi:hypothetical protein